MRFQLLVLLTALLGSCQVQAAAVFAHFMVGNTASWTVVDWQNNFLLAQATHIDAFALNMAAGWSGNLQAIANAFGAAHGVPGFELFFSFDYAGNGSWAESDVIYYLTQFSDSESYYQYNGAPFVSTFEGSGNADDWINIKAQTGCFFMPDWSSQGAAPALALGNGVADGLFSWAAWPWGDRNMTTFVDAAYNETLAGKPYMMPVSPWFYTNLPGYNKNWLWRGDDLWYQRWQQIWYMQPEFVEIISWNDFGESHYIGPLDSTQYEPFETGRAPFNYAENMPHDGWREFLPFVIDTYKNPKGRPSVDEEKLVVWYRTSLADDCDAGGTTGNTASQLQMEFPPSEVTQDRLYISALLTTGADVTVEFGDGIYIPLSWDYLPPSGTPGEGGPGIYHTSVALKHCAGLEVDIVRGDSTILDVVGNQSVSADNCVKGLTNWNAWVAYNPGVGTIPAETSTFSLTEQTCVAGYSVGNFNDLCEFTCSLGYCPIGACVCTGMGVIEEMPKSTGTKGYPANGDANYAGLCTFACNLGHCPSDVCSTTPQPPYVPSVSPFLPPACTGGTGSGDFVGLCSYSCGFGYCPENSCTCTDEGALGLQPNVSGQNGYSLVGEDSGLCNYACGHTYCPPTACATAQWPYAKSFIGYGDSYSAGIGASCGWVYDDYDNDGTCLRCEGSHVYPLLKLIHARYSTVDQEVQHVACSGAIISEVTSTSERSGRIAQTRFISAGDNLKSGWATLSIGGNDAGFGKIATSCLMWKSDSCQKDIEDAQALVADPVYRSNLTNTYTQVMQTSHWPNFLLVVTGYAQFFNIEEEQPCAQEYLFFGSYLTLELRNQINTLVVDLNAVIQGAVEDAQASFGVNSKQVVYFDTDSLYDGHRFCEPGKDWKTDSWFLTIYGNDVTANNVSVAGFTGTEPDTPIDLTTYATTCEDNPDDPTEEIICNYAVYLANGGAEIDGVGTTVLPAGFAKALHPKTIAHYSIAVNIFSMLTSLAQSNVTTTD